MQQSGWFLQDNQVWNVWTPQHKADDLTHRQGSTLDLLVLKSKTTDQFFLGQNRWIYMIYIYKLYRDNNRSKKSKIAIVKLYVFLPLCDYDQGDTHVSWHFGSKRQMCGIAQSRKIPKYVYHIAHNKMFHC